MLSLGHKYPYKRRTNDFLAIYVMVKNRSYGVRKGICDQGFNHKCSCELQYQTCVDFVVTIINEFQVKSWLLQLPNGSCNE